ncbi:signal recognition particle subunit [Mycoemilia scoparia]|uniref:Signal recognition particle subunit n=1 Tax=Mycoemilia scoparia TaxID=417184 RepID=A0A9W7ZYG9_9FUNG|nr:signal recognition particle subunit [Mycoemilia scoparia]
MDIDDMDFPLPESTTTGGSDSFPGMPQIDAQAKSQFLNNLSKQFEDVKLAENDEQFRDWICLYPIYFDKSRSLQKGRKLPKSLCVDNPHVKQLAEAVRRVGCSVCYEPHKTHPRDFFNQGRVRVRLNDDNKHPVRPDIPSRKVLMQKVGQILPSVDIEREKEPTLEDVLGYDPSNPPPGSAAGPLGAIAGGSNTTSRESSAKPATGGPGAKESKKSKKKAKSKGGNKGNKGKQPLV